MVSREIYFICSTPGTLGNLVGRMLRSTIGNVDPFLSNNTFQVPEPEKMTADFFFTNISVPETGNVVINAPFLPNYEILNQRFPGCKIIVITHELYRCNDIASSFFQTYYNDAYDFGADYHYKNILQSHAHLFSNLDAKPWELSVIEKHTFIKILAYHKLLDGFYCHKFPSDTTNVMEIKFRDIYSNIESVEANIEAFTGKPVPAEDRLINKELAAEFFAGYINKNINNRYIIGVKS